MSNSNFDKNGLDNSETHWLQYAEFVSTAFAFYFWMGFFNAANFITLLQKFSSYGYNL